MIYKHWHVSTPEIAFKIVLEDYVFLQFLPEPSTLTIISLFPRPTFLHTALPLCTRFVIVVTNHNQALLRAACCCDESHDADHPYLAIERWMDAAHYPMHELRIGPTHRVSA
jgi:hypothetical protein